MSGVCGKLSHDLLAYPAVAMRWRASKASERGCTVPLGWLPALRACQPLGARWLKVASARIERQEFPVHKKRMFMVDVAVRVEGNGTGMDQTKRSGIRDTPVQDRFGHTGRGDRHSTPPSNSRSVLPSAPDWPGTFENAPPAPQRPVAHGSTPSGGTCLLYTSPS